RTPRSTLSLHDALPISAGSRVRPDSSGHLDLEKAESIHGEVRAGRNDSGRMVLRHDGGTVDLAPDAEARPFVDGDIMPSVVEKKDRKSTRLNSSHDQIS